MLTRRGFTLMELLIVVILVSILAAIGFPNMTKAIERSYWREAQDILLTIYAGERTYFFANNTYYLAGTGIPVGAGMTEWRKIYMDDPNLGAIPVKYCVTAASATTFSALACRTGACTVAGCTKGMSIDQNRAFTGGWYTTPP